MTRKLSIALMPVLCVVSLLCLAASAHGVNINDTRLLTQPAISDKNIAFIYAGNLWVADLDGKNVRRLTSDEGTEFNPVFSPDGSLIAFSAQYDGNVDVYVVPTAGGVPKRLTWHPSPDVVQGFTPDGSAVLFTSPRAVFSNRYTQLYTVPVNGGLEEQLPIPYAAEATYSPDGSHIAYNPLYQAFNEWKHYRGGTHSIIWLFDTSSHGIEKIPQPESRCNDVDAMWMGDKIYFRSDRNGEFNLFSYDLKTKAITQLTSHNDFPVLGARGGGGRIIYEQAGYLHILDPKTARSTKLTVGVPADLVETRPRYVSGNKYIRNWSLSPTGARVALEFRGEIVTAPAEKGDSRNITNTPGVNERSPAWSPDGKSIAYFSDESGEYELYIRGQDGRDEPHKYKVVGAGFYDDPVWSPDSQKIAYTDNSFSLYVLDVKSGSCKKVASQYLYGPARVNGASVYHTWSPDSNWIAYNLSGKADIQSVYVYSLAQDKSFPITDGLTEVSEPVFDQGGKYLYFFGSTDAGPVKEWFAQSNEDMRSTNSIYVAVLRNGIPSPLAKESDEEKIVKKEEKPLDASSPEAAKTDAPKPAGDSKPAGTPKAPEPFSIDLDGITDHILAIPLRPGNYTSLEAGADNQFYYLELNPDLFDPSTGDLNGVLHQYDLAKRKDDAFLTGVTAYEVSADKKKLLYYSHQSIHIVATAQKPQPGQGKVNTEAIQVRIDPRAEWTEIFNDAWRINRDYFYAPNMHGVDWKAMREKYAVFLPDLASRGDLNRVMQWMFSELSVGHHRLGGGDFLYEPKPVPGGLLGADYAVENGRYRFKKIYGGLNWNPGLRSPLTEPGVDVKAGEYLLAVHGQDLRPPTNLYSMFENTAGKLIDITVGPNPDGSGSRTVSVVPIANEYDLRNRDWVEGNLKKVTEATGGRVAYVYVPNTANAGHDYFKRYFFPQSYKDGIIVDERFNGGGQAADYYIDILRRPVFSYWAMRYGADLKNPADSIQGPKVLLTNETAGSGGDYFPWMFRKAKLGTIVGTRTWGGLVGILGFPALMDGGAVTAPNFAFWTPEEGYGIENVGVPPDVEVEQTPADVIAGHDPQLEKAIEIVMEKLKENPPATVHRPPYPVKTAAGAAGTRP
ncbi:MAG TPA: PDZ domain-containing protein [Blastocatellia bacterium]